MLIFEKTGIKNNLIISVTKSQKVDNSNYYGSFFSLGANAIIFETNDSSSTKAFSFFNDLFIYSDNSESRDKITEDIVEDFGFSDKRDSDFSKYKEKCLFMDNMISSKYLHNYYKHPKNVDFKFYSNNEIKTVGHFSNIPPLFLDIAPDFYAEKYSHDAYYKEFKSSIITTHIVQKDISYPQSKIKQHLVNKKTMKKFPKKEINNTLIKYFKTIVDNHGYNRAFAYLSTFSMLNTLIAKKEYSFLNLNDIFEDNYTDQKITIRTIRDDFLSDYNKAYLEFSTLNFTEYDYSYNLAKFLLPRNMIYDLTISLDSFIVDELNLLNVSFGLIKNQLLIDKDKKSKSNDCVNQLYEINVVVSQFLQNYAKKMEKRFTNLQDSYNKSNPTEKSRLNSKEITQWVIRDTITEKIAIEKALFSLSTIENFDYSDPVLIATLKELLEPHNIAKSHDYFKWVIEQDNINMRVFPLYEIFKIALLYSLLSIKIPNNNRYSYDSFLYDVNGDLEFFIVNDLWVINKVLNNFIEYDMNVPLVMVKKILV